MLGARGDNAPRHPLLLAGGGLSPLDRSEDSTMICIGLRTTFGNIRMKRRFEGRPLDASRSQPLNYLKSVKRDRKTYPMGRSFLENRGSDWDGLHITSLCTVYESYMICLCFASQPRQ